MTPNLIILTDLGQFKAYRVERTARGTVRLELREHIRFESARERIQDQVRDMAGQRGSPTNKNWGAPMADDHNLRLERKRKLCREVAGHVRRLVGSNGTQDVWLVAQPDVSRVVMKDLPAKARQRVTRTIGRDLVKLPKRDLITQLELRERQERA